MDDKKFRKGPHAAKNKTAEDILDGKVSSVDERKTVVLDEDLENVEFDDKVWLYWKRNRNFIILLLGAVFAVIVGTQGWKIYSLNNAAALASAYEASFSAGNLEDFSKANPGTKLGAVAALEVADKFYLEGKYDNAKILYTQSAGALKTNVLFGRAKLGEAMCEYMIDPGKGKSAFEALYNDNSIAPTFRAEAGYLWAQVEISNGNNAGARKILEDIAKNQAYGVYTRLASDTLDNIN